MKTYKRLTFEERVKIESYFNIGWTIIRISDKLSRSKSTISREISRYPFSYSANKAQVQCDKNSRLHNYTRRLDVNDRLFNLLYRFLKKRWSPQQISVYLKMEYGDQPDMQLSYESIYTYIYLLPKGELKRELISYLRQKKKSRYRRKGANDKRGKIPEMISIEERPAAVEKRSIAGHWEGDLIMGKGHKSAIGTIVERKTKTVLLVKLKAKDARTVRKSFERKLRTLPQQMTKSMTYDQGVEMSEHMLFTKHTKIKVYFCHPASPWERGTNENTNMLIRDYFPKGTDFNKVPAKELLRVQNELNERIRKGLEWKSPKDVFKKEILVRNL